ncbi:MAG: major capsid protein [Microviridae sp.]|nr:MAG: major capsid protein [Microviridae sp.]
MQQGYQVKRRDLVSQAGQSMIERPDVPRSRFVCAWTAKKTFDAGYLIPFLLDEVYPGDHIRYDVTAYLRMATPLFPLFDNQSVDTFFFFVPMRLVWSNWQKFMGEQLNPSSSIAYTIPQIVSPAGGHASHTIYDHFGLPVVGQVDPAGAYSHSALPLRAYYLIWQEWFKDENMDGFGSPISTGDGPDAPGLYGTLRRAKMHDYFTSCLPWPQKFTAPTVPIGQYAPVKGLGYDRVGTAPGGAKTVWESPPFGTSGSTPSVNYPNTWTIATATGLFMNADNSGVGWPLVYADLSQATGLASINVLRQAWQTQMLLERDARGGTRYTEIVKSHFGVTSPDGRLQRPEFIGGGSSPLNVTPIAQTAPTAGVPLGAIGGAGTAVGKHRADYASTEHGMIIGLINVRTELSYQQGLHRFWTRSTRYDFYWPSLAGLGEQAVLTQEIYCKGLGANDQSVFGYQERWQELRTRTSEVTGLFRSGISSTIDAWHLAQNFTAAPVLGGTFIVDNPPMTRVLAAGALATNQQFLSDILIRRDAVRPMPMYGTPSSIGRF